MSTVSIFIVCIVFFAAPLIFAFYLIGKREGTKEVSYDLEDYLKEKGYDKMSREKVFEELCRIRKRKVYGR